MIAHVNDIDLYYEDRGNGPVIIFIHGLGEDGDSWRYQMDYFEKSFRVISLDLRGHARSQDGDTFITMNLFALDILALMDLLKIDAAHFVGLSMGGLICQELTMIAQQRMLTMTLADAAGFYPPEMAVDGLEARLDRIKRLPMSELGAQIALAATAKGVDNDLLQSITQMFQGNRQAPYAQATESTLKADYRAVHADIETPTLILVGEFDPVTPLEFAQYLNTHIKQSVLSIIPKASHMSKLENPVAFNQALSRFIAPFEPQAYEALT